MCLDILYKTITQPVGITLDYLHEGELKANVINYVREKSPIELVACALTLSYISYKGLTAASNLVIYGGSFHSLRGSTTPVEVESNNNNFKEAQIPNSESSLSGIVDTQTDHLPSF